MPLTSSGSSGAQLTFVKDVYSLRTMPSTERPLCRAKRVSVALALLLPLFHGVSANRRRKPSIRAYAGRSRIARALSVRRPTFQARAASSPVVPSSAAVSTR